uniref:Ribonuclease P protein subunit p21-like protein n=2 Tax=Callorhinchus milii TaxID=7868 RepID=V9LGR8_CALMI
MSVKDKDAYTRLNFLHQAAHLILNQCPNNQALVRFYCHTQRSIAKRLVLRHDPSVKRTICKRCSALLIPGISCTIRQRKKNRPVTVIRCVTCGLTKRFENRRDYQVWSEHSEAQLQHQTLIKEPVAPQTSCDASQTSKQTETPRDTVVQS